MQCSADTVPSRFFQAKMVTRIFTYKPDYRSSTQLFMRIMSRPRSSEVEFARYISMIHPVSSCAPNHSRRFLDIFALHEHILHFKALSIIEEYVTMARFANPFRERVEDGNTGVVMGFLREGVRNHLVAWLAEFAGTFLFLFFSFSIATVANTPPAAADSNPVPDVSKLLYIALGFGCSVAINVWIFYRISGGQLNPAVSRLSWRVRTLSDLPRR